MDTSRIARNGRDMVSAKLHGYTTLVMAKSLLLDQFGIKNVTKISKRWLYKKLKANSFINMKTFTKSLFETIYLQIVIMFSTSEYLYHHLLITSLKTIRHYILLLYLLPINPDYQLTFDKD